MAWTSPMTAVANATFDASEFNQHVRDNLLETMPGKATSVPENGWFFTDGANSLLHRSFPRDYVGAVEETDSDGYTDLDTIGPQVTVDTGERAFVMFEAQMSNESGAGLGVATAVEISGATSVPAADEFEITMDGLRGAGDRIHLNRFNPYTLTAGTNTFTMKYKNRGAGTARFSERRLAVFPY